MTLPASGAISFSCINTELCRSSTAQLSMNCSSVRTLFGQASGAICMNTGHGKSNTTVPGAPTSVGGSASSSSAISVTFSAPASNGGLSIDLYQAISSPGCITATAASSPISVTGLSASTAYTFKVRAHNSKGYGCYSSSSGSITTQSVRGCSVYTTPGTYTFTAPAGVTYVSALFISAGSIGFQQGRFICCCIGCYVYVGGRGGPAGGVGWANAYPTTPGNNYSVKVGSYGSGFDYGSVGTSSFTPYVAPKQTQAAGGSCNGGAGYNCAGLGHGGTYGAGGRAPNYSGAITLGGGGGGGAAACALQYSGGGAGGTGDTGNGGQATSGSSGVYGGAGGGGGGCGSVSRGGGGGGTGLYGVGSSGSGGGVNGGAGSGGSGGSSGSGANGGSYGGGGGGAGGTYYSSSGRGIGGGGAVRIVWPGNTRSWPSTDLGA